MRERRGRVVEIRALASDVSALTIGCDDPASVRAEPGQFVSIRVPGGGRRSYSIISGGGKRQSIEVVLKATPGGGTAALLEALDVGVEISYFGPMGYFLLDPPASGDAPAHDIVLGATGVGITPLLPMAEAALAAPTGEVASVRLFWGLRRPAELFLEERLAALKADPRFSFVLCYSREGGGYITEPLVALVPSLAEPHVYLSGRFEMIHEVIRQLTPVLQRSRVHTEVFFPSLTGA